MPTTVANARDAAHLVSTHGDPLERHLRLLFVRLKATDETAGRRSESVTELRSIDVSHSTTIHFEDRFIWVFDEARGIWMKYVIEAVMCRASREPPTWMVEELESWR